MQETDTGVLTSGPLFLPQKLSLDSDVMEEDRQGVVTTGFYCPSDLWLLLCEPQLPAGESTPFTECIVVGAQQSTPSITSWGCACLRRNQLFKDKLSSAQREKQNAVGHNVGVISLCCQESPFAPRVQVHIVALLTSLEIPPWRPDSTALSGSFLGRATTLSSSGHTTPMYQVLRTRVQTGPHAALRMQHAQLWVTLTRPPFAERGKKKGRKDSIWLQWKRE